MKKILLSVISASLLTLAGYAQEQKMQTPMDYRAVPMQKAQIVQEGQTKEYCQICGMTLPMFYKTNHAATHKDAQKQYCSIHCMVEDKEVNGSNLSEYKVVDNSSLTFIDAKKAFYVVGSNKPATMAQISKYAFAQESDAQAFAKENGGEVKLFDEVYALVAHGMQADKEMIAKRQAKMQQMGEKLYAKMCKPTEEKFTSTGAAKAYIVKNQLCGEMKGKNLQAVGIYLSRR